MEKDVEKILIQQLSELAGMAPSALAVAVGIVPSTLTRHTTKNVEITSKLSLKTLGKIAEHLNIPASVLVGHRDAIENAVKSGKTIPELPETYEKHQKSIPKYDRLSNKLDERMGQISFGPDMIPILGHANASSSAIMLNHDDPIGEAPRHPNQKGVRNAFYLKIYDESMAPRYYPGERAAVNGGSMPLTKEDCIIEMNNGEAYIKQFVRTTSKDVVCRQLNPDKEWKRALSDVKAIHAVVGRG